MKVLSELQSFLNNDVASSPAEAKEVEEAREALAQYQCFWCTHTNKKPYPDKGVRYTVHEKQNGMRLRAGLDIPIENATQQWKECRMLEIGVSICLERESTQKNNN